MNNNINPSINQIDINNMKAMSPDAYYQYMLGNIPSVEGLGAMPSSYGVPPSQPLTDEEINARLQSLQGNQSTPDLGQSIRGTGNNLFKNALANMAEIGTGLAYVGTHAPEVASAAKQYFQTHSNDPVGIGRDALNVVLSPYNTKVEDFGKKPLSQILAQMAVGAYEHPVDAAFDAMSLGLTGLAGKGLKAAGVGRAVAKVEAKAGVNLGSDLQVAVRSGIDVTNQQVRKDIMEAFKPLESDVVQKASGDDLVRAIKSAETGIPVEGTAAAVKEQLRELSTRWDDVLKKKSPQTYVNPDELAITQKIVRDTGRNFQEIRRDVTPIFDTLKTDDGLNKVKELADSGNDAAKRVLEGKQLYDNGDIFPVTHGMAQVDKSVLVDQLDPQRVFNKRFSTREYGNATYEDIAKQLQNPTEYIQNLGLAFGEREMAKQIAEGSLGTAKLTPVNAKDTVYISKQALDKVVDGEADLKAVLKTAETKVTPTVDDVPLDKVSVDILTNNLERTGGMMQGVASDLTKLAKQTMLGGGTYIGGNAITAMSTAMLNSGPFLISDIISAIRSRGNLMRELGLYRTDARANKMSTPITQAIANINDKFGGKQLRYLDRHIQNYWGEVAAHNALRKHGVKRLADADKEKLAKIIFDTRRGGLLNDPVTSLPKGLYNLVGATNPFFNWVETATKSTYHQMKNAPFLTNVVLNDILGHVGYDKEMQNRLQLNVKSDKPYVSYKFDSKTGEIKETTSEFIPITASFKFAQGLGFSKDSVPASMPLFTDMINVVQGKDRYGKPIKRAMKMNEITQAVGNTRWKMNPQTGQAEQIGGQADEVLATAIKDLFVPAQLWNRTLAPAIGGLAGMHYNQPYAQSILGDFSDTDRFNNILIGGNPERRRTGMDIVKAVTGRGEYPYYEDREYMTPSEARRFLKGVAKQKSRRLP